MDVQNEQTPDRETRIRRALLALRQTAGGTVARDAINTLEDEISGLQGELLRLQASVQLDPPPVASLAFANLERHTIRFQISDLRDRTSKLQQEVERLSAMHPKHAHPKHAWE